MAIYRIQSKLFAGTAGMINAAQGISAGTGDNINTGIQTAQDTLKNANTSYMDQKKALSEGYNKWKGVEGNTGGFKAYIEGEGKELYNAAQTGRNTVTAAATNVGTAAGKDVSAMANKDVVRNVAQKEVGIGQAIKNTWNKGAMGKAGLIGAGIGTLGLGAMAVKGMQKEFSDDLSESKREAAIIGSGLVLGTGGVLLAKHGKLGFTKGQREGSKAAYDKVSGAIKNAFKAKEAVKEAASETASKGGKYSKEDWKAATDAIRDQLKNIKDSKARTEAIEKKATEMGFKPID